MIRTMRNPLRRKSWFAALLAAFFLGTASPAYADIVGMGVTGKAGTTGLGLDLTVPVVDNWVNFRAGYNNLSFISTSLDDLGGIDYSGDLEFQDAPILIDLHPLHGSFRITGGVYWLDHDAILTVTPTSNITVGSQTFTPSQVGSLRAGIQHGRDFGPYFGIGWGNAADDNLLDLPVAIGFSADLGMIYAGDSRVGINQIGGTVSIPQSDLNQETVELEDDLDDFPFYPVLTLGLHIRF